MQKLKVLIVEDEFVSQNIMKELLHQKYWCEVDIAKTATEALDLVNDRAFEWDTMGYDVILMDIYLPDINGDLLTEVIRKTETQTKLTPIIAISGRAHASDRKIFQGMGITDLLLKPITLDKLDRMFNKYLKSIASYYK
jgi:CheY-like chemotaxis protein